MNKQKSGPQPASYPARIIPPKESSFTPTPWSCRHGADGSGLEAFSDAAGDWITVATTVPGGHIDHAANADLIVRAVNDFEPDKQLIRDLVTALDLCLQSEGLTWEAEQEASIVIARAKLAIA